MIDVCDRRSFSISRSPRRARGRTAHARVGGLCAVAGRRALLPLSAGREAADRLARQEVRGQRGRGARGAVATRRRRAGRRGGSARISRERAVAVRPARRDSHAHRARMPGAAPLDRARRRCVANRAREGVGDLDAAPHLAPGRGQSSSRRSGRAMHARFHAALVSACGLDWLLRFRTMLFEQSERYRRISLTVTPRAAATRAASTAHLRGDDRRRRRCGGRELGRPFRADCQHDHGRLSRSRPVGDAVHRIEGA